MRSNGVQARFEGQAYWDLLHERTCPIPPMAASFFLGAHNPCGTVKASTHRARRLCQASSLRQRANTGSLKRPLPPLQVSQFLRIPLCPGEEIDKIRRILSR